MGVTGLWNLIGPCGKPVPVETLENKILAVDISIWLHQVVKGFQDNKGGALNNAHLLGLFHRLCKLLHYRIKPIFIFDGKVPQLKRDTIAKRSANRNKILSEAERIQNLLLQNLANEKIVQTALGASASELLKITSSQRSPQKSQKRKKQEEEDEDLFKLPEIPEDPSTSKDWETATETEEDDTEADTSIEDLQAIDVTSKHFKKLPADVRYDILTDIKDARKQSSWGRLHELPSQSDDFSTFQMKRLLKRRQVQVTLEETEQEMSGVNILSYDQIQNIFQQSDNFDFEKLPSKPIASDENVRFLYIKNLKKTLGSEGMDVKEEKGEIQELESIKEEESDIKKEETKDSIENEEYGEEFETDLKKAIAMSLETSTQVYSKDDYNDDSVKLNKSQKRNFKNATKLARGFMIEYGGMNDEDIDELLQEDEELEQSMMFSFSRDQDRDQPSTSKACLEEIVEIPESQEELKSSSDEEDFVEIPESQDIVISTSKDFNEADDLFADVFKENSDSDDDFIEIPDSQEEKLVSKIDGNMKHKEDKGHESEENEVIPDSQEEISSQVTILSTQESLVSMEKEEMEQDSQETICSTQDDFLSDKKDSNPPTIEIFSQEDEPLPSLEDALREAEKTSPPSLKTPSKDITTTPSKEDPSKTVQKESPKPPTREEILKSLQNEISSIKSINVSKTSLDDYLAAMKPPKQEEVIEILDDEDSKQKILPKTPSKSLSTPLKMTTPSKSLTTPSKSNPNSPSIKNYFEVQYKIKRTPDKPEEEVTPRRKRKTPSSTPSPSPRKSLFPEKATELQNLADELEQKRKDLEVERNRKGRMGTSISERMQKECMHLLRLFGIPYIVAPTEAEAQCAYLNMKKLTHGTITDDSDIWLFGGQTVYKNFFMQHKNVMEFKIENIQNTFNVNRGKLIQLAMLVGSDYSTGINGIGAVTALEILGTFAINERNMRPCDASKSADDLIVCSLERFREWWSGKGPTASMSKNTLKKKLKNIDIHEGFPNKCIVEAYLHPTVEQPSEKFEWGEPNLEAIEEFTKKFMGWTSRKTNETILPVLKRFNEKKVQSNIKNYFETQKLVQNRQTQMSKRVKKAVERLANDGKESEEEVEKVKKKRAPRKKAETAVEGNTEKPKAVRKRKSKADEEGTVEEKAKPVRKRKSKDGEEAEKPKVPRRRKTGDVDDQKIPLYEEDVIPQKKKHEEEILQNREKAAEILRSVKGRK
ncbi:ERCC5 family protein [Megaselia abdita]